MLEQLSNFFKDLVSKKESNKNPFSSFWMAGFECTDQLNAFGNRVDFLNITAHFDKVNEDYKNLSLLNIKTVREGIRWSQVEKTPYQYDWSGVKILMDAAKLQNIQIVWDICHFGFPSDLTPLHPMFANRFAAICRSFVKFYRSIDPHSVLIVTPINEVSFLSWLGGDARGTSPYCINQGWEVKYHLMKAYIEGVEALKNADSTIRIMTTEPLINIVSDFNFFTDGIHEASILHEEQFQVTEILCGRMCPELGGRMEYLDILGYNYYFTNQWAMPSHQHLHWKNIPSDSRFKPLNELLVEAYNRYECPIVLSETSHPKEDRPDWITMIGEECLLTLQKKVTLWGVCWYPIIDRPDWDHLHDWHQSGIWDVNYTNNLERILNQPVYQAFIAAQQRVAEYEMQYNLH